jgi:pyrophosphatase PpaX
MKVSARLFKGNMGNPDNTQAILFDLDGTLIDTTSLILTCFDHSWQSVCGLKHSRASLIKTFGMPLREAMRRLLFVTDHHQGDETVEQLLTEYRSFNVANHDVMAVAFEGTQQVIAELRKRGYRTGVVTSKGRELALRGLRLCSLEAMVDTAVFLEDTDRHKPGPEPILAALERLKVPATRAAYVGDSCHDIVAGRAAGVRTVAALWGPMPRADLECERPDYLAESISDLLEIFD